MSDDLSLLFRKGARIGYKDADDGVGVQAWFVGAPGVTARGLGVTKEHALGNLFEELFTDLDQMTVADADNLLTHIGKQELVAIRALVWPS